MTELGPARSIRMIERAYLASLTVVGVAVTVWAIAFVTDTIDTMQFPWDSLIYAAVLLSVLATTVTGAIAVATSGSGRLRGLALIPIAALAFFSWILFIYGQTSTDGSRSRDVIAEVASQPRYVPILAILAVLVGLPVLANLMRSRRASSARPSANSDA